MLGIIWRVRPDCSITARGAVTRMLHRMVIVMACLAFAGCRVEEPGANQPATSLPASLAPVEVATAHYAITSTADQAATDGAGLAAEALITAYAEFVGDSHATDVPRGLRIRLYGSRSEFLANNRSRAWAEAFYFQGVCHAYVDPAKPNPYQWLIHEAVHQLNRELTGYAKEKWLNEGLATYLGTRRYVDGRLHEDTLDLSVYPLPWLERWELTGDWATDVQAHRVIPLRNLITGQGEPSLDHSVNAHYLGWWSLTHFLLTHGDGRYAKGYHHLLRHGGSLVEFEKHIGSLETVEAEWYSHFYDLVRNESNERD